MNILMIAQFSDFSFEGGNGRFDYLLKNIDYSKHNVEFITSIFNHGTKKKRVINAERIKKLNYKLTFLDEPGYKKNVSFRRLFSHRVLAQNLKKYLYSLSYKPDVIYCAVPSLDVGYVSVKFANKHHIKFIVDIQDLWPEAFKMKINFPVINDLLFFPLLMKENYIYSHSNEIVAVSDTYVKRALSVNKSLDKGHSVFLGTDLEFFDKCANNNKKEHRDNFIRLVYIGTLGISYDLKSVIDAVKIINDKGINNIRLVVMGDGPLKKEFYNYSKEKQINCEFTGRLEYPKMVGLLCSCDIAINPIKGSSVSSIINKVGDYAAAGLPVINTQISPEYRNLLNKYNAGFNCNNGDPYDISSKIELLLDDLSLITELGIGNRRLAEEKFDRSKTYMEIINLLESED